MKGRTLEGSRAVCRVGFRHNVGTPEPPRHPGIVPRPEQNRRAGANLSFPRHIDMLAFRGPHTGDQAMGNPFVHVELMSTDVGKAKAFYGKLFAWKLEDMPMPDKSTYTILGVGAGTGGGLMKNPFPGAPSMWMPYVLVDALKAATAKAKSLGGTVIKEDVEVQGMGIFTIIPAPAGAMLGLWETTGG